MFVKCLAVGPMETNCYIVCDKIANKAAVIDPGFEGPRIVAALEDTGCEADLVILTHGHFDHVSAVREVLEKTGAKLAAPAEELHLLQSGEESLRDRYLTDPFVPLEPDILLRDGGEIKIGQIVLKVLATPGHTRGSICLVGRDTIFSGDTLFRESAGRTDFPTSSRREMQESLKKLAALEGDYQVLPGHGEFTTLSHERESNPFLNPSGWDL